MLVSTIKTCVEGMSTPSIETYVSGGGRVPSVKDMSNTQILAALITLVIVYAIVLLVGKYLWNNILVKLIPAVKPAKNVWEILGFMVLMSLIFQR